MPFPAKASSPAGSPVEASLGNPGNQESKATLWTPGDLGLKRLLNMQSASVAEVKIYLSDILAKIELGKEVVITRLGQPIARLSPAGPFPVKASSPANP